MCMKRMHYIGEDQFAACGMWACFATASTTDRALVTCKRCLASLAKRDREFQRKARQYFADRPLYGDSNTYMVTDFYDVSTAVIAARAIAREEGRP